MVVAQHLADVVSRIAFATQQPCGAGAAQSGKNGACAYNATSGARHGIDRALTHEGLLDHTAARPQSCAIHREKGLTVAAGKLTYGALHLSCYSTGMIDATTDGRSSQALYFVGIALSVPTLISLIHRQWALPVAPDISQFIALYRALADGIAAVIHAPLRSFTVPPPPLIDLHILSFAGMGMMTRALEAPGEKKDTWHGAVWGVTSFAFGYLLVGVFVIGACLAAFIASPVKAFRSDRWIETTPILEGPQGRLRRERAYRLERDLARITAITLTLVGSYLTVNALLIGR